MSDSNPSQSNEKLKEQYFAEKLREFEDGCLNHGLAQSCFSLGEWHHLVGKDVYKAAKIYDENCFKRDHANSCNNLASMYISGALGKSKTKSVTADASTAQKRSQLDSHLDKKHVSPTSNSDDENMERTQIQDKKDSKVVPSSSSSSSVRAPQLEKFPPTYSSELDKLDSARARALMLSEKACKLGNNYACGTVATILLSENSKSKQGKLDEPLSQSKVKQNVDHALDILERLCKDERDPYGCARAASLYLAGDKYAVEHDAEKGKYWAERACSMGHPRGCHALAVMFSKGEPGVVVPDAEKANRYREKTLQLVKQTGANVVNA